MTGPRFALALATTLLATPTLLGTQCLAQDYPTRPIKIIVPFGAGGPADVTARLIGNVLQENFGQPFVVENRTGAGGVIGTLEAAKSPPDGYTLLMMSNTQTANESLVPQRKYELMRDLAPIAPVNYSDLVIVVHPQVPAKTLQEFIALAKSQPGKLNYASSGQGTRWRAVQNHGRDRPRARALPQQRGSAERRHRRSGADDDRRASGDGTQYQRKSGASTRHNRQDAFNRAAEHPDGGRSRSPRI